MSPGPTSSRMRTIAVLAIVIAALVEISQLWHPVWLEDLRDDDLFALVLGRGFLWGDFVRYAAGCLLGGLLASAGAGVHPATLRRSATVSP